MSVIPLRTLAEVLGLPDPETPAAPVSDVDCSITVQSFCREVLNSKDYRESVMRRIRMDDLPPAVECLFHHYASGRPVERVEVKDTTDLYGHLSLEELEANLAQVQETLQVLRAQKAAETSKLQLVSAAEDVIEGTVTSVH